MPHSSYDVTTIGNAIVDVIAHADDAFLARHGLVKGSMRLIEQDEAERLYADMGPAIEISGGSAANTAFGVGSFGGRAAYIGKVADDQFGQVFRHDIRANGIAFETEITSSGQPTARSFILVTPDGERTMNTALGACQELGPDDVPETLIRQSKIVYLEGYLFDRPEAKKAFYRAADLARAAGGRVSLTLSDSFCVDRYRAEFLDLIRSRIDILFANTQEITALYETDFAAACELVRSDVGIAAVTRSELGSLVISGDATRGNSAGADQRPRRHHRRRRPLRGGLPLRPCPQRSTCGVRAAGLAGGFRSDRPHRRQAGTIASAARAAGFDLHLTPDRHAISAALRFIEDVTAPLGFATL